MTVVLGHSSSWQYWKQTGLPDDVSKRTMLFQPPSWDMSCEDVVMRYTPCLDEATVGELCALGIDVEDLHIIVGDPSHRRRPSGIHCHQYPIRFPEKSILRISKHVYISKPELTFYQKATENSFSFEKLILLGYGICGRFAIVSIDSCSTELIQIHERSTVEHVEHFLDSIERANSQNIKRPIGIVRAKQAMQHVLGTVESPQEARISMLEFLEARLGGNAVKPPECNGEIVLSPEIMQVTGRKCFRCDFLWREEKIVLEYNGNHHGQPREVGRDAEKYNALQSAGFNVILASSEHIYDLRHTEALAKQLRNALGQRAPRTRYNYDERKRRLRRELGIR